MKKVFTIIFVLIVCITSAYAEVPNVPEGADGLIVVPCINVTMPVYHAAEDTHECRQAVIDEEHSALVQNWGTACKICDHVGSEGVTGEWYIQKVFAGAYAYFYTDTGRYYYECYATGKTEYDGNEYINGRLITPCSSYDIMLSCCAEDSDHHFIAVFRRLKEF